MFELLLVKRDHAKYTLPRVSGLFVRSAAIDVLSLKTPCGNGADEPDATTTERLNSLPSFAVAPLTPPGFSYVATHSSPNSFSEPAGSSALSEPANSRPSPSQASTGSPALAVRMCARAAYGVLSPGYPGMSDDWNDPPPFCDR